MIILARCIQAAALVVPRLAEQARFGTRRFTTVEPDVLSGAGGSGGTSGSGGSTRSSGPGRSDGAGSFGSYFILYLFCSFHMLFSFESRFCCFC